MAPCTAWAAPDRRWQYRRRANDHCGTKVIAERAIERGEIPADTDPAEVIHTLASPIYHRYFISGGPLGPEQIDRFARIAAHAARHGLLTEEQPVPAIER